MDSPPHDPYLSSSGARWLRLRRKFHVALPCGRNKPRKDLQQPCRASRVRCTEGIAKVTIRRSRRRSSYVQKLHSPSTTTSRLLQKPVTTPQRNRPLPLPQHLRRTQQEYVIYSHTLLSSFSFFAQRRKQITGRFVRPPSFLVVVLTILTFIAHVRSRRTILGSRCSVMDDAWDPGRVFELLHQTDPVTGCLCRRRNGQRVEGIA